MPDAVMSAVIGGVAGLLSGAVASIIAPWVQWGIEKRRMKHQSRAALIKRWREVLVHPHFSREHMLRDPDYATLETLLSEEGLKQMRRPFTSHIVIRGGTGNPGEADHGMLMREIARIEREWGLL
ncbi:MAG: hypothetical protein DI562_01995 [Stenotrophomonas acidaminiphila]|nr:MAG: hypothetical protein DI562_01995 [Stenotrophomonas acidaminiphila]